MKRLTVFFFSSVPLQVRLNVLSCWHPLQQLHSLALIGLAFTAADAPALHAFLAAGSAHSLTSLVLGDTQVIIFFIIEYSILYL